MMKILVPAAVVLTAAGCTGATWGSGVGDRYLEHPPWVAGSAPAPEAIGWFAPGYQRGASQPALFDPEGGPGTPVAALLDRVRSELRATGLAPLGRPDFRGVPPEVRFGCETDPVEDCVIPDNGKPVYRLTVGRPSRDWVAGAADRLAGARVDAAILITLNVGQYLPRQRDFLGRKEIELGRDHVVRVPWLTALDRPVSVLQLTAALVGPDGRALRIAAEGLLARRTDLVKGSFGLQALITDAEVEDALAARREDLPGRPRTVDVAVANLLAALRED